MAKGYYRNLDDTISDPDLIAAKYQLGQSAFFEVALTLAEQADNLKAGSSSSSSAASASPAGGFIGGGAGGGVYCPREDQYVWVGKDVPEAVRAGELLDLLKGWRVYNPLTGNFNDLVHSELIEDQPMVRHETTRGAAAVTTTTHKSIRNTGDTDGYSLIKVMYGGELLVSFEEVQNDRLVWNLYQDSLDDITVAGRGNAVAISLDREFIYAVGEDSKKMTLAHNRKALDD